ncbi:hypothetical protein Taro_037720 [Colocasia esculenta]|uniref:Uncharacterized protein n=1 Tax=Colocasia esculenta TaxID=4460 RepID=A0A843WAM3_COLES|nr:hypothetical protein [Colocasia esculenta]
MCRCVPQWHTRVRRAPGKVRCDRTAAVCRATVLPPTVLKVEIWLNAVISGIGHPYKFMRMEDSIEARREGIYNFHGL